MLDPAIEEELRAAAMMIIYCTGCEEEVLARLTNGQEIYPPRADLHKLPFWICDLCQATVGCHHKTEHPTRPLGYLANYAMKNARKKIHRLLDPLWKSGKIERRHAYAYIGKRLGHSYHNGELRTLEEARNVYEIVAQLHNDLLDTTTTK